jgi:2-keto-4-pentenoate hydratase
LSARGIGVGAGQIISTGTCTGLQYVEPDQTAVADFGGLGSVELSFTRAGGTE